jgi:hypothetical protein
MPTRFKNSHPEKAPKLAPITTPSPKDATPVKPAVPKHTGKNVPTKGQKSGSGYFGA